MSSQHPLKHRPPFLALQCHPPQYKQAPVWLGIEHWNTPPLIFKARVKVACYVDSTYASQHPPTQLRVLVNRARPIPDPSVGGTCCRHLEEILGLGTLGALQGRVKRHMAAAGLSTLLVAVAGHTGQFVVPRLAKIMAVCLRALAESKAFMVLASGPVPVQAPGQCLEAPKPCLCVVLLLEP